MNILTPINNGFKQTDGDRTFIFVSKNNIAYNQLQNTLDNKISKVARDPAFDKIADNTYPTVIGMVGSSELP